MQTAALVTDYDQTLAATNFMDPATIAALRALRQRGVRIVLVTGRTLPFICGPNGLITTQQRQLFDRIVCENGGVMYDPASNKVTMLCPPPSAELVQRLTDSGCQVLVGWAGIHVPVAKGNVAIVNAVLAERDWGVHTIPGNSSLVILPKGIDKLSGMRAGLNEVHLVVGDATAIGDGLNDIAMVDRHNSGVQLGVAVANAHPALKAVAGLVTRGSAGAGVRELVRSISGPPGPALPAYEVA